MSYATTVPVSDRYGKLHTRTKRVIYALLMREAVYVRRTIQMYGVFRTRPDRSCASKNGEYMSVVPRHQEGKMQTLRRSRLERRQEESSTKPQCSAMAARVNARCYRHNSARTVA